MGDERKIYCNGCRVYLGVIRDAKLRKGMVHLCKNCETKRVASDLASKTTPRNPFDNFMDSMNRGL